MRKMRRKGNGGGISDPHSAGSGDLGADDCPIPLEPPPGVPIRTAWVAGRLGIAFDGPGDDLGTVLAPHAGVHAVHPAALAFIRDLDVDERPFIWDLPEE